MANPWLRETFVIPGVAGQAARTINMIKIDDASKGQLLALLKGSTTDQGPNPMPAIGLMGHTQGDVDFPINSINVGDQNNPNHVSFDDHTVRTLHAKALCARRGLKNDDTASPKRAAIERLGRSDANAVVELDILWLTPEDEAEVISFIDPNTPEFAVITSYADYNALFQALPIFLQAVAPNPEPAHPDAAQAFRQAIRIKLLQIATLQVRARKAQENAAQAQQAQQNLQQLQLHDQAQGQNPANLGGTNTHGHLTSQSIHTTTSAEIAQLKSQLECIMREHQDLHDTNKTISTALRTTNSRQRDYERRTAASDTSVFGPLRTRTTRALHQLEDIRNELQETTGNISLPPTLETSIQRAVTTQSNVETVSRMFPMGGQLAQRALEDLHVRGGMTRSELADYEAIHKRIKTDTLLTDTSQPQNAILYSAAIPQFGATNYPQQATTGAYSAQQPLPTQQPNINLQQQAIPNPYLIAQPGANHMQAPVTQPQPPPPTQQLLPPAQQLQTQHQQGNQLQGNQLMIANAPNGGGMGRGQGRTTPAWAQQSGNTNSNLPPPNEHPQLVGKPPVTIDTPGGPRIMSVRGLPYYINPQALPLGTTPKATQPPTDPCRFCSQPGHMAFYCPTLLRWKSEGVIDDRCYLK